MSAAKRRPRGTITFLFTDIERSTLLWERYGELMRPVLERHYAILRAVVEEQGGIVVKTTGDGLHAAFETAVSALITAVTAQRRLNSEQWAEIDPDPLRVRMGLHTGEAQWRDGDYYGTEVNRAARIMSLGHGGQVLLSGATVTLIEAQLPEQIALRDLGNHPLRGFQGEVQIFQVTAPDLPGDFPPLKSDRKGQGNLPTYMSSFVGRSREMAEVRDILNRTRLLTLTGPGGTGKTRLSLQIASTVQAEFSQGAWLVELAPVADPEMVVKTTAAVFGLQDVTSTDSREMLVDYLREKQLLLILDNCEHMINACAQLAADLISACPRVTILASSREELGVYGETIYHLPTLSLPSGNGQTAESAGQSEAVQLFVERATAVQPRFELDDTNASAIAKVVLRLDGIPLAIELAAARLKIFSVEQLEGRLDQLFRLLTGGSRTAMPRQQTLRALIDWSYDLLEEDEREFFRRLSVFVGGFTFEGAESVAYPLDAYILLPQLISKSLISRDKESASIPRYIFLETIRQYAGDRLVESGELEETRERHFAYYESLAKSVGFGSYLAQRESHEEQLSLEVDNLRAAVKWGSEKHPQRVINMIWNLMPFLSGLPWADSVATITAPVERLEELGPAAGSARKEWEQTRLKGLMAISLLNMFNGQLNDARRITDEVIELFREADFDPIILAMALFVKAQTGYFLEDPDLEETLNQTIAVLEGTENKSVRKWMMGQVLLLFAETASRKGNQELVEHYLHESSLLVDSPDEIFLPWMELTQLLILLQMDLDPEVMKQHFKRAIDILNQSSNRRMAAMAESEWAHKLRHNGEYEKALAIYRRMLITWRELGHRAAVANILENIAFIDRAADRPSRAVTLLGAAERMREAIKQDMLRPEREEYEKELGELKRMLPQFELDSLWTKGRTMSLDEVTALALTNA